MMYFMTVGSSIETIIDVWYSVLLCGTVFFSVAVILSYKATILWSLYGVPCTTVVLNIVVYLCDLYIL